MPKIPTFQAKGQITTETPSVQTTLTAPSMDVAGDIQSSSGSEFLSLGISSEPRISSILDADSAVLSLKKASSGIILTFFPMALPSDPRIFDFTVFKNSKDSVAALTGKILI